MVADLMGGVSEPERTGRRRRGEGPIRILLVEDDLQLAGRLRDALAEAGFVVECAPDGDAGWYLGDTQSFDAVVLDLGLPTLSGLEVLKRWRTAGRGMPVLILTGRAGWTERVEGLNAGADDYLGKPFQVAEVVARLRALIRRAAGASGPVLRHGEIALDTVSNTASLAGQPLDLTAREFQILSYLMLRQGRIVPQSDIADHVYALDAEAQPNTIEVLVARLRKKIGREAIRTVRGLGYRLG